MSRIVTHAEVANKPARAEADGYDGTVGHVHAPCPPWNPRMAEQNIPSWAEMDKAIAMVVTGVAMQHVLLILPILLILPSTHDMQSVRNSWGTWLEVQAHLSSIACAGLVIGGMIVLHRDMPGSSQQLIYGSCLAAVGGAVLNLAFAWELRNDILISCWLY